MKHLFLLLMIALGFSSCMKEESFEVPKPTGVFTMKIDGEDWVADQEASASYVGRFLRIYGLDKNNQEITFYVEDPSIKTIDFTFEDVVNLMIFKNSIIPEDGSYNVVPKLVNPDAEEDYWGKLEITEFNESKKYISGEFSGKLYNFATQKEVEITEGKFYRVPLSTQDDQPTIPDTKGTATWKFKNITFNSEVSWTDLSQMFPGEFMITLLHTGTPMNMVAFTFKTENNAPKLDLLIVNHNQGESYMVKGTPTINIQKHDIANEKIQFTFSATMEGADGTFTLSDGSVKIGY